MILVTGGTGLVGSHLLLRLLEANFLVRALYREESRLKQVEKIFAYYTKNATTLFKQIEWVKADLLDIPALEGAFENVKKVYHTAALISFDPSDFKKLQKVNTEGTTNIVNLCIANQVQKLCYVSTIGTIGKNLDNTMATEETEWVEQDINVYALTKYAAEMEVWRGTQEGLNAVIVNPGVILGPGYWKSGSGSFFTTGSKGYSYYPPGGTGFVTIWDTIKAMMQLMEGTVKNERFILVGQNLKFQEILGLIAENMGKSKPSKKLTYWQLNMGRFFDWLTNLCMGNGRRITKNSIKSLKNRGLYSSDKIKKVLTFEFEPIAKTVQFCCQKFKEENP